MKKLFISLLSLLLLLSGCSGSPASLPEAPPEQAEVPAAPAESSAPTPWQWRREQPEAHGMNGAALSALHTELEPTKVLSAVIVRDDVIVDEYYKDGYDQTSIFDLHSCSKSITSVLVGIAIDKGYIPRVDVPISHYFPEILEAESAARKRITIRHLLTHTSGIQMSDDENWEEWRSSENWVDFVLSRPVTATPGTTFRYSTGNTHLLAAILEKATGKTAFEFGKEMLFDPLEMESVRCGTDPQGISDGGNGFQMNVYDIAKFGRLFLNGGVWEGEQIISPEWVEASTSLQFDRSSGSADYGYQWWVRTFGSQHYRSFFAQGHFGQYIFVVPELQLIAVFTSHHTGGSSMYWQFVEEIVSACAE